MEPRDDRTRTSAFGVGKREGHDASAFYSRFTPPELSDDEQINRPDALLDLLGRGRVFHGSSADMHDLPDASVALVVTSPPYFVGKEYELAVAGTDRVAATIPGSYLEFLDMLREVFAECARVLEPGGRIAVNVANLGRKPYRSLSADVIGILQDDLRLLLRGEVIWEKSSTSSGSCAWGSFAKATNPVIRDMTERVIIASRGRFARAVSLADRRRRGLPNLSTTTNDEFLEVTRDVWRIEAESATRIGHPAPFPVDLPRRLIDMYTYVDDIVVDPFAGSGSTLVAAARAGRIGVGYDTDASYVELARTRLDAELDRADRIAGTSTRIEISTPALQQTLVAGLAAEERQEHHRTMALRDGANVRDIAEQHLLGAGFTIDGQARHPSKLVQPDFLATDESGLHRWWVEVVGGFTTTRPGMQRTDDVWKLLGRLHVLRATAGGDDSGVLVLTPSLPKSRSPSDRALRAVGPRGAFDVIELYDPAGMERLSHYGTTRPSSPLPGFWTEEDIADGHA